MKRSVLCGVLILAMVGIARIAFAADTIYTEQAPYSGHFIPRRAVDMGDGTFADKVITGSGSVAAPVQGTNLFNSHTTGAANTAVAVTINAVAGQRVVVHSVQAFCAAAGTSGLTITDGGTTKWATPVAAVTTTQLLREWAAGLTAATNSAVVITLATCGVGNTGTLTVQASQF